MTLEEVKVRCEVLLCNVWGSTRPPELRGEGDGNKNVGFPLVPEAARKLRSKERVALFILLPLSLARPVLVLDNAHSCLQAPWLSSMRPPLWRRYLKPRRRRVGWSAGCFCR